MSSPNDMIELALPVLARRYGCDRTEATSILQEWAENTFIDIENVAAWVLWEAPTLESRTSDELVSH